MSSQKLTNSDAKGGSGRSRPTNNQLLYKAYLRWDHYSHKLHGNPQLPAETEACASVTSAFLQVMSILFEVESLRVENPRNILQMLSTNTRRTKVVELSSGTHRVPDELRRHSLSDGVGGQYSTNLDRNRYGADDQYLSTVIRYDLEFLRLCPCLVDVEIIDAKNGSGTILVSAGDDFCICAKDPARKGKEGEEGSQAKAQQSVSVVPWPAAEAARGQQGARGQAAAAAAAAVAAVTAAAAGGARPMLGDPALAAAISAARADASAAAKSAGGSDLFDALLMAATGGGNKGQPQQAAAAAAAAVAAAVEEGQVSSTPAVWPVPQPAVKRQRSRLYQSPNLNAPSIDQPTCPTSADASAQPKPLQSARKGSSNALNALSTTPDAAKLGPMALAKERSGENGLNSNNDMLVQSIMEGIDQGSLDAMDLGDLDGHDAEGIKASLRQANGGVLPANGAVNLAGMSRAFKDSELRRLEDEVKTLKEGRAEVEARLEEARVKEQAAAAAATALRSDLGAAAPPPSAATQAEEKKVLGQQTWELAKERLAQRAQVSVPRMVSVLRLEVQRLNVARQQAETARQHAEERAAGSQAVAEALQRELAKVLAASDGPHAHQARAAVDADNARLRQQLEEARAALRRVEAERSALEECLAVTSVSSSAAPPAASMSLQPAPVTPQPHRNANPPSNMSDGDKQPEKAAVLLALTGREGSTTPPNSTTPDKTAPAAAVAPPSQAPPAAKQAAQPAKQSSPSAQAMPSSTIVTPVGEESQKRKRPQEDDGTDPNPSSAAPAAVVGAMELPSDGLLPAAAAAAFMATPPQSKEMADAQAAVAAIAASQPGATPAQIINAAIIVSQNMAAAAAAAAAATAAAPTSAALAAAAGFGGLAGAPIGSAVGKPGAMSFDAITAITAGVPDSFNKQAVVQGLADGAKVAAGAVQEGGAADASDAAAADFDVDQMLAPQAGMAPPVSGAAGAPLL